MKRYIRLLVLLLLVLPLTGCWDRLEINDVAIVDVVGIDKAPGGRLRLSVSIIVPELAAPGKGEGGDGSKGTGAVIPFSAEGDSIMDAEMKIQERLSRRLFWAHARVLVLGEEYARAGVRPALDFWSRHREPRLRMKIVVTPGRAGEFIQAKPRLEHLLSEAVRETLNMRMQTDVTIKEFLGWLRSESEEPFAPRVTLVKGSKGEDALVSGTAIFQDDRLIGWLSDVETRGLLWVRGEIRTGVATADVPSGGKVSLQVIRSRTTIKPDFSTGRLRMKVYVNVEDDVYESSALIDLGKVEVVQAVQEILRTDVKERVQLALGAIQKRFGSDVLGFGDAVRRAAPRKWEGDLKKRWATEFPKVPVDVIVNARVRRTGEHSAPLSAEKQKIKSTPKELLQPKE